MLRRRKRDGLSIEEQAIVRALDEWHAAERWFEQLTEPELIRSCIYEIQAKKLRYEYLIRSYRTVTTA